MQARHLPSPHGRIGAGKARQAYRIAVFTEERAALYGASF
jgi:hypothetical protein